MEEEFFLSDDHFFIIVNNDDLLMKFLMDKGLLNEMPNRCKNCWKYNTYKIGTKKGPQRETVNVNSGTITCKISENPIYICKK